MFDVLIIGGGTAGIMTAAQLTRKKKNFKIAIIEPQKEHAYQAAYTLVGAGTFKFSKTHQKESKYIPKGVTWIQEYAETIKGNENKVILKSGAEVHYKYLVVVPGLIYDLDMIPGFKEALENKVICSNYIDPEETFRQLQKSKGHNYIFTQANTPIKCGGAPQKAMYLSEAYLRKKGKRGDTNVAYYLPGGVIFGVEPFKSRLESIADERDLVHKYKHVLKEIDPVNKVLTYEIPQGVDYNELQRNDAHNRLEEQRDGNIVKVKFDFCHMAPPSKAPDVVRNSDLSNDAGWAMVNQYTMKSDVYDNIYAFGDCANLPTAKTGAAIRKQVPVVVAQLNALLSGEPVPEVAYSGYSSCPITTDNGAMLLAEFKYDNVRDSDPILSKFFDTSKESWAMWILKKFGLPFLYWKFMLRGKM